MNKKKSDRLKVECARLILRINKDINLKHAHRAAKKLWTRIPPTKRTPRMLNSVCRAAVCRAYEVGRVGGTWTPWQSIRKVFRHRGKYDPITEDKKHESIICETRADV
jgi:hypothetical protein